MNDLEWAARNVHKWPTLPHDYECKMIYVDHEMDAGWGRQYPTDPIDGSEITKSQWLAERARLQNKPKEWEGEWLFQDKYGWWHSFDDSETPMVYGVKDTENYCTSRGFFKTYAQGIVLGDWRDTLEKKPEQMQRVVTDRKVTNRGGVITASQTVDYKPADQASPPTEEEMCSFSGQSIPKHINHRCVMTKVKQEWKQGELPPVGTTALFGFGGSSAEFSFEISQGLKSGSEVDILAHFSPCEDGDMVAVFAYKAPGGRLTSQAIPSCFNPLQTEEEKAVEEMLSFGCASDYTSSDNPVVVNMCKKLYRAGYRKP